MPDSFEASPYYNDPDIKGAALITGHNRYEQWFAETDDPQYAGRVASYKALTMTLNGVGPNAIPDPKPPAPAPVVQVARPATRDRQPPKPQTVVASVLVAPAKKKGCGCGGKR